MDGKPKSKKLGKKRAKKAASKVKSILNVVDEIPQPSAILKELLENREYPKAHQRVNKPEDCIEAFETNKGVAFHVCDRFFKFVGYFGLEYDDIRQMIEMALWVACLTHNREKSKLTTWAWIICPHFVSREINKYTRPGRNGEGITILTKDKELVLNSYEDYRELNLFDRLTVLEAIELNYEINYERDADILVDRLIWDRTLDEIGQKLGLTGERVRQLEERGLRNLKNCYKSGKAKLIS